MEELNQLVKELSIPIPDNIPDLKSCQYDSTEGGHTMTMTSVFDSLSTSTSTPQDPIPTDLINFICRNGPEFLRDPRFPTLDKEIVQLILKRDDLHVPNEAVVLDAVIRWGQAQCGPHDRNSPLNFGPFIKDFLPLLRHPCDLTPRLWESSWKGKSPDEAMAEVLVYHEIRGGFNPVLRQGCTVYHTSFARVNQNVVMIPRPKGQGQGQSLQEEIRFLVNSPLILYAVSLAKGIFGENFTKNEYDYRNLDGRMELCWVENDNEMEVKVVPEVTVKSRIGDRVELSLSEDNPVSLIPGRWTTLSISVSGFILETRRATRVTKKILLDKASVQMATGLSTENHLVYVPMTMNIGTRVILPQICIFRRDSSHDSMGPPVTAPPPKIGLKYPALMDIRHGFIDELVVSYNKMK